MKRFIVLALVGLVGCATQQKFADRMNGFVGQPEGAIIGALGAPSSVYSYPSGGRTLTFNRSSTIQTGGGTTYQPVVTQNRGTVSTYGAGGYANSTYSGTSTSYQAVQQPTYDIQLSCQLNVSVDDKGVIRSWQANGNHCVSQ